MSSGHRHSPELDPPAIDDDFYRRVKTLVDDCKRDRDHTIPWLANRTIDGRTVLIDSAVPEILPVTKLNTGEMLPYHELAEWLGMNEGFDYDTAHATRGNPCEKRRVEELGGVWADYQDEMAGYIKQVADEKITNVPADIDKRVFVDDDDRAALEAIIADNANAGVLGADGGKSADAATKKTLYVHRPLTNALDLVAWFKDQGFATTLDDMHVTVAYSHEPIDWTEAPAGAETVVVEGGARSIAKFDKGAVVLKFESVDLADRWKAFRDLGASWKYDDYAPHVTITYDGDGVDLDKIEPYAGKLEFGAEVFAEINDDWQDEITEKSGGRKMTTKIVHKAFGIETKGLADKRQVIVNISAESPDRVGDIIVQKGIDFSAFMKIGGTVLWQHDPLHPVAKCLELGLIDGKIRALVQFPPEGTSVKSTETYNLISEGVINAASIGFDPKETEPLNPKDPYGPQRYPAVELMEFSFVSVPCAPDATIVARALDQPDAVVKAATWKVGASRNLPIGDDKDWDGDAAKARIFEKAGFDGDDPDTSWARKAFLAYDASAPNLRASYRLPFADLVDGRLAVVPAGIRNAASRLPQTDIPDDVKTKARDVIDSYEAKMAKSAVTKKIKGLYEVAELAHVLGHLGFIHDMSKFEEECEQDPSKVPAMLAAILTQGAEALVAMTQEECAEMLAGRDCEPMAIDIEYVELAATPQAKALRAVFRKAGRVLSDENMKHLDGIQKCYAAMSDLQTKAADLHDTLHDDVAEMAQHIAQIGEHTKAMFESTKGKKPDDDEDGDDNDSADNELAAAVEHRKRMVEVLSVAPPALVHRAAA